MADEKRPGEEDAAAEVKKPKTFKARIQESGFVDVTLPGRDIGFIGLDEYTPPDSTPEEEFGQYTGGGCSIAGLEMS
jgi:hypothetical protein